MGLTKPRAAQIFNLDYKQSTRVVTTSTVNLAGGAPNQVDGVNLSLNDRILVTSQNTPSQNGLYLVDTVGSGANGTWIRTSDGNENGEIEAGMIVMVTEGTVYADTQWKLITDDPIVIGTTALTFTQNYMANSISGGTSNVVVNSNANVTISSAGTANVLTVSNTGAFVSGGVSATGNVLGGNLNVTGNIVDTGAMFLITGASGNVTLAPNGTNVIIATTTGANITGTLTATGNGLVLGRQLLVGANTVIFPNLGRGIVAINGTTDQIVEFNNGSVNYGYLYHSGTDISLLNQRTGSINLSAAGGGNINFNTSGVQRATITSTGISVTGAVTSNNVSASTTITATTSVTAANIITTSGRMHGCTSVTLQNNNGSIANVSNIVIGSNGNITLTPGNVSAFVVASGNLSVTGSITTASNISLTGNIIDIGEMWINTSANGNINLNPNGTGRVNIPAGILSVTGNIQGGNVLTGGLISATGNITGGNLITGDNSTIYGAYTTLNNQGIFQEQGVGPRTIGLNIANGYGIGFRSAGSATDQYIYSSNSISFVTGAALASKSSPNFGSANIGVSITQGGFLSVVGNTSTGNLLTTGLISAAGNITGNYFLGNVFFANGITASKIYSGNSEVNVVSNGGNVNVSVGGTSNVAVFATTGEYVSGLLSVTGNTTSGNLLTGGVISATGNLTGNYLLANIAFATGYTASKIYNGTSEANIGTGGGNANISIGGTSNVVVVATTGEYVTGVVSASGNVTGGNIVTSGSVTNGNITIIGANIVSTGSTIYIDPNGSGGTDGNVIITGNLSVQGNVTYINSNNITTNDLTINMANNAATASAADGGGIGVGPAGSEYISLTYNSTSNIWVASNGLTSQGILSATGNVTGANLLTGGLFSATGNATVGNLSTGGQATVDGNITGGNVSTGGIITATGNILTQANVSVGGSIIVNSEISANGSIVANSNLFANAIVSAAGNVVGSNLYTSGQVSASGNVTGINILGNGSNLTGILAFKTVAVDGGSQANIVANSIASTLTFGAGTGLVWTTDANTGILTISTTSSGTSIFADGGDMGLVTEPVTASEDLGNVADVATIFYDLGSVVSASGLIYPSQLILPTYVPGDLPSADPAAQFVYLSTSSIGPMTAFSDGANWRFTSSGNIVS